MKYSRSILSGVALGLLLATMSVAQRWPMPKRQPALASTGPRDSTALRRQAITFIKQVQGQALTTAQFRLENKPVPLRQMDCLQEVLVDKQTFTPAERQVIEAAAARKVARWATAELTATQLLDSDSVHKILKNWQEGWPYFHQHIGLDFHAFSFPIFIRNGTYCLFYSAMYCGGLCAEGQLTLYKREGAQWKAVQYYCQWVS